MGAYLPTRLVRSTPKLAGAQEIVHQVDFVNGPGSPGSHKLVVKVLGTSGHPRVDIDAFIVLAG